MCVRMLPVVSVMRACEHMSLFEYDSSCKLHLVLGLQCMSCMVPCRILKSQSATDSNFTKQVLRFVLPERYHRRFKCTRASLRYACCRLPSWCDDCFMMFALQWSSMLTVWSDIPLLCMECPVLEQVFIVLAARALLFWRIFCLSKWTGAALSDCPGPCAMLWGVALCPNGLCHAKHLFGFSLLGRHMNLWRRHYWCWPNLWNFAS